ncbi:MAG: UDP-4-amino-4,6-dideoxy-N-acetyl-beta-L-altrosamine transaminase [bacterium]|nr:MAG: UDP-4-amino-4,6-dideoxy-N-acetyl-beta-L-altrosamine transaminase [bacterium]
MSKRFIPYGRQWITDEDIEAVVDVLRSDWITQGPTVESFEGAFAEYCGARYAVAVANGTAALHLAALAAEFDTTDEVITSPVTFVASANCILYAGANPVLADINEENICIDPDRVAERITPSTRGVIPIHFAGHPCDMPRLWEIAKEHGLILIEDAAHALGASYSWEGQTFKVGSCAHSHMTTFSFHPVKHITSGEGGMITTNDEYIFKKLLLFRSHGITREPDLIGNVEGPWYYEMKALGFNYRITDIQCALGLSQMKRLDTFISRRRKIAQTYNKAFENIEELILPQESTWANSSWHLYVIQFRTLDRLDVFNRLREKGLGVNVHYIPIYRHPFYRKSLSHHYGDFPVAERYYARVLTLPLFPLMKKDDISYVVDMVRETVQELMV